MSAVSRAVKLSAGPILVFASVVLCACGGADEAFPPDAPPQLDAAVDAAPPAFAIDLFGQVGHRFHFDVSPAEAASMDQGQFGGGFGDLYNIGSGDVTYADDLIITDAVDGETESVGKVQLKLIGQSTFRTWAHIPNLRVDTNQFTMGNTLAGYEHLRLNNGQVGSIYREAIAHRVWRALGYYGSQTNFVWAEAPNQWGATVSVPYTLIEVYKEGWCEAYMPGGSCPNMWEGYGGIRALVGQCQIGTCDDTPLIALADRVDATAPGAGFTAATADLVDWDDWRTFQCLSWITGTGDDYIHNMNNLVIVESLDGRMHFLPYSIDISAAQEWYSDTHLLGFSELASGCQNDPACWPALLDRCDQLITAFDDLDVPATIVDPVIDAVASAGMVREGDEDRAAFVRDWYATRSTTLRNDPVWDQTPCIDDSGCVGNLDGLTYCQQYCRPPLEACVEGACPDGFWCDGSNCRPGN